VQEKSRDDVQAEAHGAHDQHQLRIVDLLHMDEALYRLEQNTDAESEEECSVEESTQ
jgi:hypothetical protein